MSPSSLIAAIIPVFSGLLGVALSNLPISLTAGAVPAPLLAFMAVYFWSLVRPDLMPPAGVFLIGLTQDVLAGGPPGLWTASFLAAYALLDRQREAFASLAGVGALLGFALVAFFSCATAYVIACVYFYRAPPMMPLLLQLAATVLCYILVLPLLNGIQHRLIGPLRSEF